MDQAIAFINASQNAKEYVWNFGDGKTSTDENPTHTFTSAGDFIVKLIATGSGGTDSISQTLPVMANLSGIWLKSLNYPNNKITGTMNLTQHENNTLTGSWVYDVGMGFSGTIVLDPTSFVKGDSVTIKWDGGSIFNGIVNKSGKSMGGKLGTGSQVAGTWTAVKL